MLEMKRSALFQFDILYMLGAQTASRCTPVRTDDGGSTKPLGSASGLFGLTEAMPSSPDLSMYATRKPESSERLVAKERQIQEFERTVQQLEMDDNEVAFNIVVAKMAKATPVSEKAPHEKLGKIARQTPRATKPRKRQT